MPDAPVVPAPVDDAPLTTAVLQHDLEPDESAPEPVPAAPTVAAPAILSAPIPAIVPASEAQKMVPLAAVHEERGKRQTAEDQLRQATPILQALLARPDLLAQLQGHTPAPNPDADAVDLAAIADRFVLYLSDGSGKPDLARAAQVRDQIHSTAKKIAKEALEEAGLPALRQSVVTQQAQGARARIEAAGAERGLKPEHLKPLLDQAMASDPDSLNNPQVGAALIVSAFGLQAMMGGAPAPVASPVTPATAPVIPPAPIVTEPPGARPVAKPELTPMMSRIAKRHGWNQDKIAKSFGKLDEPATVRHIPVEKED